MSDCSCVYVSESDQDWSRHAQMCTARKVFACEECSGVIAKGDQYESTRWYTSKDGGVDHSHDITCATCVEIRDTFFCNGYWSGMVLENLFEHLEDIGGNVSSECISGLSPEARRRVCAMIEEVWEGIEDPDEDFERG